MELKMVAFDYGIQDQYVYCLDNNNKQLSKDKQSLLFEQFLMIRKYNKRLKKECIKMRNNYNLQLALVPSISNNEFIEKHKPFSSQRLASQNKDSFRISSIPFLLIILSLIMMPTIQEANEEKSVQPLLPSQEYRQVDSEYLNSYMEFIGKQYEKERQADPALPQYLEQFAKYGIEYCPSTEFVHKLKLTVQRESINSEVMSFLAHWGKFRIKLIILHSQLPSCSHRQQKHEGSFGRVYITSLLRYKFALKCIPFSIFQNQRTAKIMAIKQFLLLKLAAALKIGPQMQNYFGFDIIMYKNCAQFAMEACTKIQVSSQQIMSSLKQSLHLMHVFGFVHIDIKPENLMMSQHFKKPVFIDFGLSELISAPIGKKISFGYRGTLLYCGEQMIKSFETEATIQMDLYYNDCESLRKSYVAMQQKEEFSGVFFEEDGNENQTASPHNNDQLNFTQIIAIPLKYCLFLDEISSLFYIMDCNPQIATRNLYKTLLMFLKQLPMTQNLKWFYDSVHPFFKEGFELTDINLAYSSTADHNHNFSINQERKTYFQSEYGHIGGQMERMETSFFRKNDLETFLMNTQCIKAVKKEVYYKRFMDYVNFSNNVHSVTMKQRTAVSLICLDILKPNKQKDNPQLSEQCNTSRKQGIGLLKQVIELLLASTLQTNKHYKNTDTIESGLKINLIFTLLQHHFILRIGTAISLRDKLEAIYAYTAEAFQEKLEMLLRVKDYTAWFDYRIQTDQIDSDSDQLLIQHWRIEKWLDLQKKNGQIKQIKRHIAFLAHINIILAKMKANSFDQYKDYRLLLPLLQVQKIGIYRFYFQLFDIQHEKNQNSERCREIYRYIEKNVACEEIMAELRLVNKMKLIEPTSDVNLTSALCEFIENLQSPRVLMKEAMALDQALQKVTLINRSSIGRISIESNLYFLKIKLQKMVSMISLSTFFSLNAIHQCISAVLINNLVNIKISILKLTTPTASYSNIIAQIENTIKSISCNRCKEIIILTSLLLKQNFVLRFAYNTKMEQSFMKNYKQIELIINRSSFKGELALQSLMNRFLLSKYCLLNPNLQEKYQAAIILYKEIRKHDIFIEYIANQLNSNQILQVALFQVHQKYGVNQFARFLDRMSLCIGFNYSYRFFRILEHSFEEVINKLAEKLNFDQLFEALIKIDQKRQADASIPNYLNIISYYSILIHTQSHKIIKKIFVKFCRSLTLLPKLISHIYQSNFYRFIIQLLMQDNYFPEQSRQIISLKRKIMKIYTIQQINSGLTFKKVNKNTEYAFQILQKRALTLGGPFSSTADKEYQYVRLKKTPF